MSKDYYRDFYKKINDKSDVNNFTTGMKYFIEHINEMKADDFSLVFVSMEAVGDYSSLELVVKNLSLVFDYKIFSSHLWVVISNCSAEQSRDVIIQYKEFLVHDFELTDLLHGLIVKKRLDVYQLLEKEDWIPAKKLLKGFGDLSRMFAVLQNEIEVFAKNSERLQVCSYRSLGDFHDDEKIVLLLKTKPELFF